MAMCIRKVLVAGFICLVVLFLQNNCSLADATQTWGTKTFDMMNGDALDKAQKGLVKVEYINDESMFDSAYIDYVTIADETIIVCSIENTDPNYNGAKKYDISLYDLKGSFTEGYKLRFDRDNGVYAITIMDGELLYYRSAYKCIYKLSKNSVEYYYAPPEYIDYLHSYVQATSYRISYDSFVVDLTDPFGNTQRLIDYSENKPKFEELKNRKRQTTIMVSILQVLALFCCIIYFSHRSKHD